MHDNQSQDIDDENDHNHIHGNKENIKENTAKTSKTDYDEGAQYEEALDMEQNALQREMEMELKEKGDLKH
eukprot:11298850-Ditylum_brightwellii.AAC.1